MQYNQRISASSGKTLWIWLVLLTFFIAELLFYTWCRVQSTQIGYDIVVETKKHQELIVIQKDYQIKLAKLNATKRISKIAEGTLGLIRPTQEQIIEIK